MKLKITLKTFYSRVGKETVLGLEGEDKLHCSPQSCLLQCSETISVVCSNR